MTDRFYSKIILFGEYTVIDGGSTLALPLPMFSGNLTYEKPSKPYELTAFLQYLKKLHIAENMFNHLFLNDDIEKQIYFHSNIPIGYGTGSSGALVAAAFNRYRRTTFNTIKKLHDLQELKNILAMMESFFHGTSSGTDPLVSFLNQPVIINKDSIELVTKDIQPLLTHFYLLDSGRPRNSENFIEYYQSTKNTKKGRMLLADINQLNHELIQLNNREIQYSLPSKIKQLSQLQREAFDFMIPEDIAVIWDKGLNNNDYFMKLCGAGGGGFFLLFSESLKTELPYKLYPICQPHI